MDAELEFAIQSVTTGKQLFEQVSFTGLMSGLNTEAGICELIDISQKVCVEWRHIWLQPCSNTTP